MHVWRPLYVVLGLVAVILIFRTVWVPEDFGIHGPDYLYSWYRKSNLEEWKSFKVKFQGKEYCQDCHQDPWQQLRSSFHANIECENCHGPAIDHPSEPAKLAIDRSRELCLRCHSFLPYPSSKRAEVRGIDANSHNPGLECGSCHEAHKPSKPK